MCKIAAISSFLRRQESRQKIFISTLWIPAFAEMKKKNELAFPDR
jgi:hypothetical protein